jgi:hypothetical protein
MRKVETNDQASSGGNAGANKFAAGNGAHREPPIAAAR